MKTIVERMTSKGPLVVSLSDARTVRAMLDGREQNPALAKLAKPIAAAGVEYTHRIGDVVITTKQHAAIVDAKKDADRAWAASPRGKREALAIVLYNCDRGAFPGSAASKREEAALKALAAFDDAHPEVIRAIRAEPIDGERV